MKDVMSKAATKIQAQIRMLLIYQQYSEIIKYEREFSSIKWNGRASVVEIVGNFTSPQWKLRLKLDYCRLRGIFVKYMANMDDSKEYYYSFIIGGTANYKKHKLTLNKKPLLTPPPTLFKKQRKVNNSFSVAGRGGAEALESRMVEDEKESWNNKGRLRLDKDCAMLKKISVLNEGFADKRLSKEIMELDSKTNDIVSNKEVRANGEGSNWAEDDTPITNEDNDAFDNKLNHSTVGINFELARDIVYEDYY
eukprot:TRINITY_DN1391_c0_g1_i5.p1 TRINITY_DN1391_c0_g1~~TRINITY_DN1391_c0_g1_i5.p1  ORF type:complete len:251 (-),score=46.44 TRINITY_DN1391_c0_g1_i5:110-862(-)